MYCFDDYKNKVEIRNTLYYRMGSLAVQYYDKNHAFTVPHDGYIALVTTSTSSKITCFVMGSNNPGVSNYFSFDAWDGKRNALFVRAGMRVYFSASGDGSAYYYSFDPLG